MSLGVLHRHTPASDCTTSRSDSPTDAPPSTWECKITGNNLSSIAIASQNHFIISSFHRFRLQGIASQNRFRLQSLLKIASGCNRFSKSLQVVEANHPGKPNVSKAELKEKLATMYNVKDTNTVW
ncbi:unnamed protein product [Vicia faba]|uniref:Uncharacterized protein n=1 Tax=Vicia faba TaxID=3906 RepID=A0AAV0ZQ52_VICFA|nr:unnamed protein product [Vicia faba]